MMPATRANRGIVSMLHASLGVSAHRRDVRTGRGRPNGVLGARSAFSARSGKHSRHLNVAGEAGRSERAQFHGVEATATDANAANDFAPTVASERERILGVP
jgi:hypothetical protein